MDLRINEPNFESERTFWTPENFKRMNNHGSGVDTRDDSKSKTLNNFLILFVRS
jgi:hypothetical protein